MKWLLFGSYMLFQELGITNLEYWVCLNLPTYIQSGVSVSLQHQVSSTQRLVVSSIIFLCPFPHYLSYMYTGPQGVPVKSAGSSFSGHTTCINVTFFFCRCALRWYETHSRMSQKYVCYKYVNFGVNINMQIHEGK